jgi:hypothetical protein
MFQGTYDRAAKAERYRTVAAEYTGMSEAAADPFLGSYYLRIAEDYLAQSQAELRASEPAVLAGVQPGRDLRSQGLTMKNARAFLIGFMAVWTPISIYTAWITWRIAEAI